MVKTLNFGGNKFKEIDDADIFVQVVTQEWMDENGTIHRKVKWQKVDKPISLGSMVKPNPKIIGFKVEETNKGIQDMSNFFGGLFKRF